MREIFLVVLFGVVQGITEFVPISSSGHLVLLHDIFPLGLASSLGFDVALHVGTLAAVIIYFYRDLSKYFLAFLRSFASWEVRTDRNQAMAWILVLTTIPAVLAGLFLSELIENAFRSPYVVAVMLIVGALLFFIVERFGRKIHEMNVVGWRRALFIGFAQALALIPGTSRSGITITAGMASNLSREAATRFSFLMAVPVIFLAGAKKTYDWVSGGIVREEALFFGVGALVAAIVGYFAIKLFLSFVRSHSLSWFGLYRIILAGVVLFYLWIG